MADIFGIAFTENKWQLSHIKATENNSVLHSAQELEYPFPFVYDSFFDQTNFALMALAVKEQKMEKGITDLDLSFSLPVNFAAVKRVALPIDADEATIKEQALWEMSTFLTGKLADYKIIKTDSVFDLGDFKEHLFMAIHKNIIQQIVNLTQKINSHLKRVWLDFSSFQSYLTHHDFIRDGENQLLVKIDTFQIKSHLYIQGQYYHTYIDSLPLNEQGAVDGGAFLSVLKKHFNDSKSLIRQLPMALSDRLQLYFWNSGTVDGLSEVVLNNFTSAELLTATVNDRQTNAIEAIGLVLD